MAALAPVELLTPRLLLRPLVEPDAAALLEIHAEPRVMEFSNSAPWTSLEQAEELIEASRGWSSLGMAVCLGIVPKDASSLIGTCTLFDISRSSQRAEVGFLLGSSAWGRGYMTEALTAFLGYGFAALDLNRIEADTDPRNLAATRVLDKLGFVREGVLRERWITDGQKSDSALYGLLRSDWESGLPASERRVNPAKPVASAPAAPSPNSAAPGRSTDTSSNQAGTGTKGRNGGTPSCSP